uniref:Ig-like domain-containing protein n=1 Tax=Podarcis muralis TaxID=64176 RepID=A0A670K0Q7_PODMU
VCLFVCLLVCLLNLYTCVEEYHATSLHTILTVFYLHPDSSLSKPSIKVLPNERISPGQNITIECQGPEKGLNFSLYKSGELITSQVTESERNRAEFPFFNVGLEDEGNYTCQYHRRGNPFAWSEPSNATELVVRGQLYPKPSISAVSTNVVSLGGKIILRCASDYHQDVKYYLHKDPPILYSAYWNSEWGAAVFQIANARASDGGTYTCSYCLKPSNATELVVRDPSLSKPSIKVLPDERISPGQNITIECQGPEKGLNFSLYKSGELITSQVTESERNRAEFPFFNVGLEDEGNYTCQYHRRGNPFAWSEPSNATELVVRGEKIGWVLVFPLPSKSHSHCKGGGEAPLSLRRGQQHGALQYPFPPSIEIRLPKAVSSRIGCSVCLVVSCPCQFLWFVPKKVGDPCLGWTRCPTGPIPTLQFYDSMTAGLFQLLTQPAGAKLKHPQCWHSRRELFCRYA